MSSTITHKQQASIVKTLAGMQLPSGLGNSHSACSIVAINLALSGEPTDNIPDCMSEVIGLWIIAAQDAMPDDVRNSKRWKSLLPLAAGTGRDDEQERLKIILSWMWEIVLPSLQPLADQQGFGQQWQQMTTERTVESALAAEAGAGAWSAALAAWSAEQAAVAWAAEAASAAGAARAAGAAEAALAALAAWSAVAAAWATERAARAAAAWADAWADFDPCGLLERLIKIDSNAQGAV